MKKLLIGSMFAAAALFGEVIETKKGMALELFAEPNYQSNKIAELLVDDGRVEIRRCVTKGNETWCKVRYISQAFTINGFSDKKSLVKLQTAKKNRDTFEAIFGGRYEDVGMDLLVDDDGGFSIIGYTESFGHGQKDAYVVKTDRYGNKIKSFTYGGSETDIARAALRLADGGMLIVGDTTSFGNRAQSMYVAKIAKNGQMLWQRGIYNDKDDYYSAADVVKAGKKSFLIAGHEDHVKFFGSEVSGMVTGIKDNAKVYAYRYYGGEDDDVFHSIVAAKDGYVLAGKSDSWGHGRHDAYVVKIDKSGNQRFARVFGYKYDEDAKQIIHSNDGGFILIGTTDSDYDMRRDIFVVKMDKNGKRLWQYHYGTREDDEGFSITSAHGGGYILAGYTKDTKNYDKDLYLMKISENGDALWERRYGGSRDDAARKIKKIKDGYVIVGYKESTQTFSKDLYLLKVDKEGKLR